MVMLIEIGQDVVTKAVNGEARALDVLRDLAFAYRKCCHIVFAGRKVLETIKDVEGLSKDDKKIYESIGLRLTSNQQFYRSFSFHAFVTFDRPTAITNDKVIVNPNEVPAFEWFNKTRLLTENLIDARFYEVVTSYYMRKSQIRGFKKESENIPGGGDATVQYVENQMKEKKSFCLAIVDSDLKYKGGSLKETSSKVKKCIDENTPFNCKYYVIEDLSEIENLIPFHIVTSFATYKNNQIVKDGLQFCQDYFDFKKGLRTDDLINEDFYNYWYAELQHLKDIADALDDYRNKAIRCGSREKYEKTKQTVLIEGFGDKLLSMVMDDDTTLASLWKTADADLSPAQQTVWFAMGRMIFEWCCAVRNNKNS